MSNATGNAERYLRLTLRIPVALFIASLWTACMKGWLHAPNSRHIIDKTTRYWSDCMTLWSLLMTAMQIR